MGLSFLANGRVDPPNRWLLMRFHRRLIELAELSGSESGSRVLRSSTMADTGKTVQRSRRSIGRDKFY